MQKAWLSRERTLLRGFVLIGVLLALVYIVASWFLFPAILNAEGLLTSGIAVVMLLLYAATTIVLAKNTSDPVLQALRRGTIIAGVIIVSEMLNISLEIFADLGSQGSAIATGIFMGSIFLLFAVAGFLGTQRTGSIRFGLLASVWSAIVGLLVAVLFGFTIDLIFQQREAAMLLSEMQRSGITDPLTFSRYNTLESASTHLLEGPLLALFFGSIGASISRGGQWLRSSLSGRSEK